MYTRQHRLDGKCTHDEFFGQFVTEAVKRAVHTHIGKKRLLASTDSHLNDIPLREWDKLAERFKGHVEAVNKKIEGGESFWSLSYGVCTLKAAARQLIAKYSAEEAAHGRSLYWRE